jgi:hypothetical protein
MSTLLGYFFNTNEPVSQKFKLVFGKMVYALRPHIFKNGELIDGNLIFELYDGSELLKTETFTYEDLNQEIGNDYSHGYLTWEIDTRLDGRQNGESAHEYELRLTYTGTVPLKLAWIMEYENLITTMYGSGQGNDAFKPRDLEIWTHQ